MARKAKLTQSDLDRMRAVYEAWDPHDPNDLRTADDLAHEFGVSKATMYNWRNRDWKIGGRYRTHGWSHPDQEPEGNGRQAVDKGELEAVIRYLTDELVKCRSDLAACRGRNSQQPPPIG